MEFSEGASIRLTAEQAETIRREGARAYPAECCGLLIGSIEQGERRVAEVVPVRNDRRGEDGRRGFRISPEAYWRLERRARLAGRKIVGVYHSHPDGPADPSEADVEDAWTRLSYLILEVTDGRPGALRSWTPRDGRAGFRPLSCRVDCGTREG